MHVEGWSSGDEDTVIEREESNWNGGRKGCQEDTANTKLVL